MARSSLVLLGLVTPILAKGSSYAAVWVVSIIWVVLCCFCLIILADKACDRVRDRRYQAKHTLPFKPSQTHGDAFYYDDEPTLDDDTPTGSTPNVSLLKGSINLAKS